jgi:hypothetical protein
MCQMAAGPFGNQTAHPSATAFHEISVVIIAPAKERPCPALFHAPDDFDDHNGIAHAAV